MAIGKVNDQVLSDIRNRFNGSLVLPEAMFVLETLGKLNRQGIEALAIVCDDLIACGKYRPNLVNLNWARKWLQG